ncbi:MAG: Excinuclease cho [Candidatus Accumulibacter vicinus]|uniref:DNA-directed DNA polymerase n=1 Tax=Candidatus Accumulibacter vicinus TaxID=2954382 RepID=A0A084Y3E8_9PROT|nr:MAG: Excinuclease cho [Candidatus Accumulibacter vicinus]
MLADAPAQQPVNAILASEPLIFIDLETSGANFANDRIIEVGLIEVDANGAHEWSVLVNPETPLSSFITGLTGIDDAMLCSAPTFRQLAPILLDRLRGRLLIAHNARFDYGFLKSEFARLGVDFRASSLCTVKLSRKLFPEHHRHNLDTLMMRHGLRVAGARHRALADARALWDLWQCWHQQLPAATIESAVAAIVGRPELPPQIDAALIDDLPEAAGAYAFYGRDGRLLLSQRSSNLRQQVLAHFTPDKRDTALIRDIWQVGWRAAAGEFGARLHQLELARSVPEAHAAANGLCSWQLRQHAQGDFRPQLVFSEDIDFALADDLFGLYPARREALRSLRTLADAHRLCYRQLGLEETGPGEACTAYRQKNCRGVCIGKESTGLHSARLLTAIAKFRVRTWPYQGAVVLIERDGFGMREDLHLIDRWRLLGTLHSEEALQVRLADGPTASPFDPDIYRLIHKVLQAGKLRVRPCPGFSL